MNDFNFVVIMGGGKKVMSDYEHYETLDAAKSKVNTVLREDCEWAVVYDIEKKEVVYEGYTKAA